MIIPRTNIVHIRILEKGESKRGDIFLAKPDQINFQLAMVLGVGADITDIKKGDTVYVHYSLWEPFEIGGKEGLCANKDILAIEKNEPVGKTAD